MQVQVPHQTWQVLRYVTRARVAGGKHFAGVPGYELRLTPTRNNKDGTFLDDLVGAGLLKRVGPAPEPPAAAYAGRYAGEPFRTLYDLTPDGEYAAEYGEYDMKFVPGEAPVSGGMKELRESFDGRRAGKGAK